ncbi:MAG: hypothetical protein AABW88_02650 [Nanoarchaeota archaeon]
MVDINLAALFTNQFPVWFYWVVAGIQLLGVVVSFSISYIGFKAYKIIKEAKYKYFFYGFLLLGLSYLANVTLNILIRLGYAKYFVEKKYEIFMLPIFGAYYLFLIGVMLAYVSLAAVYSEVKKSNKLWLFYFWTLIVGVYTFRDKLMFNMFSAILLSFIVIYTYDKYNEDKNKNRLLTCLAFFCMFLFHLFVLLESFMPVFFIIRNTILLIGLILLLTTLSKIYGGKKK